MKRAGRLQVRALSRLRMVTRRRARSRRKNSGSSVLIVARKDSTGRGAVAAIASIVRTEGEIASSGLHVRVEELRIDSSALQEIVTIVRHAEPEGIASIAHAVMAKEGASTDHVARAEDSIVRVEEVGASIAHAARVVAVGA